LPSNIIKASVLLYQIKLLLVLRTYCCGTFLHTSIKYPDEQYHYHPYFSYINIYIIIHWNDADRYVFIFWELQRFNSDFCGFGWLNATDLLPQYMPYVQVPHICLQFCQHHFNFNLNKYWVAVAILYYIFLYFLRNRVYCFL